MNKDDGDAELKDVQPDWKTVLLTLAVALVLLLLAQWSVTP